MSQLKEGEALMNNYINSNDINTHCETNTLKKIPDTKTLNTDGNPAEIKYFKKPIRTDRSDFCFLKETDYITNGGLNKKLDKYKTFRSNTTKNSKLKITGMSTTHRPLQDTYSKSMKNMKKNNITTSMISSKKNFLSKSSSMKMMKSTNKMKASKSKSSLKDNNNSSSHRYNEEEKTNIMGQLIENGLAGKINEINQLEQIPDKEHLEKDKKLKKLEENGIPVRQDSLENESEDSTDSDGSNKKRAMSSQIQQIFGDSSMNRRMMKSNSTYNNIKEKKRIKEKIDTKSFERKIQNFRQYSSSHNENSFRTSSHSSSSKKKEIIKVDSKVNQVYDNDNNFLYSFRENKRSKEELREYRINKRRRQQQEEERKEIENNQKLFETFKQLYMLYSLKNRRFKKANYNTSSSKKTTSQKKKKKAMIYNEYTVNNTEQNDENSTIVDPNEYYTAALVGQQLLQIETDDIIPSDSVYEESKSITKEQIRQITERNTEEKQKVDIKKLEDIKEKASKTIKRYNDLFNQENLDKYMDDKNKETDVMISKENNKEIAQLDIETTSNVNTKDKNLPSLSHTYNSNTNPNKKIDIEIEPRAVLNLVEIIRILIKRKVFYSLYEIYYNEEICQRYTIAFAYFTAVLKQGTFRRIEDYCNYKTYYYAFFRLFTPFIRQNFEYFVNRCHYRKRVEYLTELLTRLFKAKSIERIYIYACLNNDEEKAFIGILSKIVRTIVKPHLLDVFNTLKEVSINQRKGNDSDTMDIKMNTYIYESFSAKSFSVEPNSVDNDRLHRLRMMLDEQNRFELMGSERSDTEKSKHSHHSSRSRKSNKSTKSVQELLKEKPKKELSVSLDEIENNNVMNTSGSKNSKLSIDSLKDRLKKKLDKKSGKSTPKSSHNNSNISNKEEEKKDNISVEEKKDNNLNVITEPKIEEKKETIQPIDLTEEKKENIEQKYSKEEEFPIEEVKEEEKLPERKSDKDKIFLPPSVIPNPTPVKEEKKLEIQLEDNIEEVITESPKNKRLPSEPDISADKETNINIEWEYSISGSKPSTEKKEEEISPVKKEKESENIPLVSPIKKEESSQIINKESEEEEEIKEEISVDSIEEEKKEDKKETIEEKFITPKAKSETEINPIIGIPDKKEKDDSYEGFDENVDNLANSIDNNENIVSIIQSETKQNDKSRNTNITIPTKEKEEEENQKEDDLSEEKKKEEQKTKDIFNSIISNEDFANEIAEEIMKSLLEIEIKNNNKKLFPFKTLKFDPNSPSLTNSASLNSSNDKQSLSANNEGVQSSFSASLNDSLMYSFTGNSIFTKSVKDKKKEISINLYNQKIGPKLIQLIKKEIVSNYKDIYENISTPMKNIPLGLMTSLSLQDAEMLRDNYRRLPIKKEIESIIDKKGILKQFEPLNKKIRIKNNVTSDDFYDNILNSCLIDSAIEIINKERLYGDMGEPLPWSSRTREIKYKYDSTTANKLADFVEKELLKLLNTKLCLIAENYDYMSIEQINMEREKKLIENITEELKESEPQWNNLEMEETQLKIETTELIMEQLYNEAIEILEHIQYSRKRPDLYQNKSIYACEEIPKLTFQITTSEEEDNKDNDTPNM